MLVGDAAVRTKESQDRRCYSYCNGQQSQSASQDSVLWTKVICGSQLITEFLGPP